MKCTGDKGEKQVQIVAVADTCYYNIDNIPADNHTMLRSQTIL